MLAPHAFHPLPPYLAPQATFNARQQAAERWDLETWGVSTDKPMVELEVRAPSCSLHFFLSVLLYVFPRASLGRFRAGRGLRSCHPGTTSPNPGLGPAGAASAGWEQRLLPGGRGARERDGGPAALPG